jgi:hypothetical protein
MGDRPERASRGSGLGEAIDGNRVGNVAPEDLCVIPVVTHGGSALLRPRGVDVHEQDPVVIAQPPGGRDPHSPCPDHHGEGQVRPFACSCFHNIIPILLYSDPSLGSTRTAQVALSDQPEELIALAARS